MSDRLDGWRFIESDAGMRGSWIVLPLAFLAVVSGCGGNEDGPRRVIDVRTVSVGDPGNSPVGIVPFQGPPKQGIYESCDDAPSGCQLVGSVDHEYRIGELEVTVAQYVAFLNTVDPDGSNEHGLYVAEMSPSKWPKYGPIRLSTDDDVPSGEHYSAAFPQWVNKPVDLVNFLSAARFINSLFNGDVLTSRTSRAGGFDVTSYDVRLSTDTESGMYDLGTAANGGPVRTAPTGFVIPSQDEWIKAAYYDPRGGGTDSYWEYPTGPDRRPNAALLDPNTGDVVNAETQPLSTYNPRGVNAPSGTYPTWCPPAAGQEACNTVNPRGLSARRYRVVYQGNVSTVGHTRTTSPWGTLDQGGNVVEWTDTVTPAPVHNGKQVGGVWRRLHGGVANARAYQLWISAVGQAPQTSPFVGPVYPWLGFRVGVIGNLQESG